MLTERSINLEVIRTVGGQQAARTTGVTMRKTGKKFAAARQQVPEHPHSIKNAVPLMQKVKFAKFDETVEIAMRLGVYPKHADQMVRGTVVLPHGLRKTKRVLAIAGADKQKEEAGERAGDGAR